METMWKYLNKNEPLILLIALHLPLFDTVDAFYVYLMSISYSLLWFRAAASSQLTLSPRAAWCTTDAIFLTGKEQNFNLDFGEDYCYILMF